MSRSLTLRLGALFVLVLGTLGLTASRGAAVDSAHCKVRELFIRPGYRQVTGVLALAEARGKGAAPGPGAPWQGTLHDEYGGELALRFASTSPWASRLRKLRGQRVSLLLASAALVADELNTVALLAPKGCGHAAKLACLERGLLVASGRSHAVGSLTFASAHKTSEESSLWWWAGSISGPGGRSTQLVLRHQSPRASTLLAARGRTVVVVLSDEEPGFAKDSIIELPDGDEAGVAGDHNVLAVLDASSCSATP